MADIYKNDIKNLSYLIDAINNTQITTILNSKNTSEGDNWTCEIMPFDGAEYGEMNESHKTNIITQWEKDNTLDC